MADGPVQVLGRYALFAEIASGGMATVHLGRLLGPVGFSRTVAIKRLHPQYAKDPDFVAMFLDEARLAAHIRHPNVVQTLDVVALESELFLVMEYVEGESLARLVRSARARGERLPPTLVGAIMAGALYGLHAAHEAKTERGEPLRIVHRDVSPQNILVGIDGVARVLDFGVAKAAGRMQTTREGQIKGKLAYMPPEQILAEVELDRRVDVYAAGVCLWEALTGRRLFDGENEGAILHKIIAAEVPPPSRFVEGLHPAVDQVVMRALERDRDRRWASAWEMAVAIEESIGAEIPRRVGSWVENRAHEAIARRSEHKKQLESMATEIDGLMTSHDGRDPSAIVTLPRAGKKRAPRRALLLGLLAVSAGLLAGSAWLVLAKGKRTEAASSAESRSEAAAERGSAQGPTSAPPPRASGAASAGTTSIPAPSASAAVGATSAPLGTVAQPKVSTTARASATARSTATSPPPAACNPPYVIKDGRRVLKPECIE